MVPRVSYQSKGVEWQCFILSSNNIFNCAVGESLIADFSLARTMVGECHAFFIWLICRLIASENYPTAERYIRVLHRLAQATYLYITTFLRRLYVQEGIFLNGNDVVHLMISCCLRIQIPSNTEYSLHGERIKALQEHMEQTWS